MLKPNRESVEVFRLCEQIIVGGMATSWHGISAQEIKSAIDLKRVPEERWEEVSENVRYMGSVVAKATNDKVSEAMKKARNKK